MLVKIQPSNLKVVGWRRLTLKTSRLLFFSFLKTGISQGKSQTRPQKSSFTSDQR